MISVQKAIFPGIAAGSLFLVLFTSLISSPHAAFASNPPAAAVLYTATPVVEQPTAAPMEENAAGDQQETEDQEAVAALETLVVVEQPAAEQPEAAEQPAAEEQEAPCSISASFPDSVQQWCAYISQSAGEHGVDPNLIASVMLQESGGDPNAYSKSGAVGLMQVMPRDGIAAGFMCINGPCFGSRPSMSELYDPEFNVSYGTRMLAGLIQRHGDVREALRAYGPMNMGYRYADIVLNILAKYR